MRRNKSLPLVVFVVHFLGLSPCALGQDLSVGVVAGTALTEDFRTLRQPVILPGTPLFYHLEYSASRSLIAGAMVEWNLPGPLSVEADGLFRRLRAINASGPFTVVTWEFPVLAKYRFDLPGTNPFIEAGPSFRTAGNLNSADPSHFGMTAGLGVERHVRGLNIAPRVRYTRWASDKVDNRFESETLRNQVAFLVGVSRAPLSNWRPLGRHVSVGVMVGTNLTPDFRTVKNIGTSPDGSTFSTTVFAGPKSFIVGPMVEIGLTERLSVEVSALHRPLRRGSVSVSTDRTSFESVYTSPTWQFPVLAKYKFPAGPIEPFVEGGPSFRLTQLLLAGASPYGLTAGGGVESRLRDVTIAPRLRFTHWAPDKRGDDPITIRNKTDFLVGLSF